MPKIKSNDEEKHIGKSPCRALDEEHENEVSCEYSVGDIGRYYRRVSDGEEGIRNGRKRICPLRGAYGK